MKFYRPTKEVFDYTTGYTTIPGELVTEKERARKFKIVSDRVFEEVEVSKKKTYWSFGCRFAIEQ